MFKWGHVARFIRDATVIYHVSSIIAKMFCVCVCVCVIHCSYTMV